MRRSTGTPRTVRTKEQPRKSLVTKFPSRFATRFCGRAVVKYPERDDAKDCKEQPNEISDQCKKSLKPVCMIQDRFVYTYEPEEICRDLNKQHCHKEGKMIKKSSKLHEQVHISRGIKTFGPGEINAMVLTKRKETAVAIFGKKFSNIFPFPDEEQDRYSEPEETAETRRKAMLFRS